MLRIRLTRVGKKNSPAYRVVVADKRKAVKRKFIEIVGHYNPTLNPKEIVINKERAIFWMNNGAQPSDTVNNLMADLGILDKKAKTGKVFGKKLTKKALKAGEGEKPAEANKAEEAVEATEETSGTEAVEETAETKTAESAQEAEEQPTDKIEE